MHVQYKGAHYVSIAAYYHQTELDIMLLTIPVQLGVESQIHASGNCEMQHLREMSEFTVLHDLIPLIVKISQMQVNASTTIFHCL